MFWVLVAALLVAGVALAASRRTLPRLIGLTLVVAVAWLVVAAGGWFLCSENPPSEGVKGAVCDLSGTSSLIAAAFRNAAVPVGLFVVLAAALPPGAGRWAAGGFVAVAAAAFVGLVALGG